MNSIVVATDCDIYTPGLGQVHFSAGIEVEYGDPNYYPLLWAGLAGSPTIFETTPSSDDISASLKAARDQAKES